MRDDPLFAQNLTISSAPDWGLLHIFILFYISTTFLQFVNSMQHTIIWGGQNTLLRLQSGCNPQRRVKKAPEPTAIQEIAAYFRFPIAALLTYDKVARLCLVRNEHATHTRVSNLRIALSTRVQSCSPPFEQVVDTFGDNWIAPTRPLQVHFS